MDAPAAPLLLLDVGATELILVAILAIMLYGGDLPDVARKAGATVRRLRGVADDLKRQVTLPPEPELQRLAQDIDPRREPGPRPAANLPAARPSGSPEPAGAPAAGSDTQAGDAPPAAAPAEPPGAPAPPSAP